MTLAVLCCWFSACIYGFLCGHESFHSEYEFSKKGIMEELGNKGIGIFIEGSLKSLKWSLSKKREELK